MFIRQMAGNSTVKQRFRAQHQQQQQAPLHPPVQRNLPLSPRVTRPFLWFTGWMVAAITFASSMYSRLTLGEPDPNSVQKATIDAANASFEAQKTESLLATRWESLLARRARWGMDWMKDWEYEAGEKLLQDEKMSVCAFAFKGVKNCLHCLVDQGGSRHFALPQ